VHAIYRFIGPFFAPLRLVRLVDIDDRLVPAEMGEGKGEREARARDNNSTRRRAWLPIP
jgi:hypothetical protein